MRREKSRFRTVENLSLAPRFDESAKIPARKKPRVLMVGMHLTKTRGGISTLTAQILESSLRDDFEFDYIESQAEDFGKFGKLFLGLRAIGRFLLNCIRTPPEIVYVHLGSNASLYRESFFIVLAKFFGRKVVVHFHAGDFDNYYPQQSRAGQMFIRRAINRSDYLIAVSNESAGKLRKLVDAPLIVVVPNAIDTTVFADGRNEIRADDAVRLLFVGAIGKLKGERDLIRALQILRSRGCEFDLKVSFLGYGAETLKPLCEAAGIADWIEFAGAVALDERIEFFQRADIFVLPTYAEAMPMSIIEAMAANLAIVSTNVGGIPELIENEVDGLLFTPGDAEDLTNKIAFLVENKTVRLTLGAKAGTKAREHFDFRGYVEKLRGHLVEMSERK